MVFIAMDTVTVSVKTHARLEFYENLIIILILYMDYIWIIKNNNKIVMINRHVLNSYYIPDVLLSTLDVFKTFNSQSILFSFYW